MKKPVKSIDLKSIKDPKFLRELNYKELNVLATTIREEIINRTSKNGGHVSSNLGVVELTMMLHRTFDFAKDKLMLDVGHQCYTHKILTGRRLDTLRKKDGVSGFIKRHESIYDCFEAGHSSTSLSAAHGMAVVRDLKREKHQVVAMIGDGSLASGLALEGLNNIAHSENSKVIIVLNDNNMSISRATGGLAHFLQKIRGSVSYNRTKKAYQAIMCKTRFGNWLFNISVVIKNKIKGLFISNNIFTTLGYIYYGPIDGHNVKALNRVLNRAKKSVKSVVVHVHTIKGKGYKFAEQDTTGSWHGVGPFDLESGKMLNVDQTKASWSQVYANLTNELMKKHENTVLINPAMINGSKLEEVFLNFPTRCFDVGICEEHAITMASGIALSGVIPIISIYSTFLQRAYDELQQDLVRMNLDATLLIDRAGLVGADGETHQGIFDEAMLYSIPHTVITMASNIQEAKAILDESMNRHGVFAIRFPRDSVKKNYEVKDLKLAFGDWLNVISGNDTVVVTFGPMIDKVALALNKNCKCDLINAIYQKPILEENIKNLLKYRRIIIYNPYATSLGFVSNLKILLLKHNYNGEVLSLAIPDEFVAQASIDEQMKSCGVNLDALVSLVNNKE